ncbi:MAG: DNA repair protein RecO [Deltaproteobacteria bacterium]|nr:DNA repair protein RecO [Deltaproteobacteria bacterium]MCB9787407.1 DNA repair protein RecO [Deltaproteobacteria bacterium]
MGPPPELTEALVLRTADSDDNKVVHLLTPDLGHVPAFARKARVSKRHTGGHLDLLHRVEVRLSGRRDRDLARLDSARTLEVFGGIRADLLRFAQASCMVDVVLHLVPEHGHEPGVYELLLRALRHLDRASTTPPVDVLLLFELRMLEGSGVLPGVDALEGLSQRAREVLTAWHAGQWLPLPDDERAAVGRALEGLIEQASGGVLKSRRFLDAMLSEG